MATLAKDFHRLLKRINKLSGGQARVDDVDWDDNTLDSFTLVIQPNASYYKGGTFKFKVNIPDGYPSESPPAVWCETDIYHPNIDPTDSYDDTSINVCCNIFDRGNWNPNFGLEGVVLGLLFLMHNPNSNDPLSPYFEPCPDEEEFTENVHRYMTGQDINGTVFNIDFALPIKDSDPIIEEQVSIVTDENTGTKSAQEIDGSFSAYVEGCNSSCAVATTVDNVEVTEEIMLNMLHERDVRIYTGYVVKSVAEQAEAATNHISDGENCDNNVVSDVAYHEEDGIDMVFVDGEFMIAQAHMLDASVTEATSNESDSLRDVDRSVAVMQEMIGNTALTHEEYMIKLLQEREIAMFNEYVDKSVAELNCAGDLTNSEFQEKHVCDNGVASWFLSWSETNITDWADYNNDPYEDEFGSNNVYGPNTDLTADACNKDENNNQTIDYSQAMCETSGASSNDTIVTNCPAAEVKSCQTVCLSKFQRSLSTPHEEASNRATGRLIDASIKTFRYFIEMYNPSKWYYTFLQDIVMPRPFRWSITSTLHSVLRRKPSNSCFTH